MKHIKKFNESTSSTNSINFQFEVTEFIDNIEKGDLFIDGDEVYCCSRVNGDVIIDMNGLWHNPNSVKKIVKQNLI